MKKIIFLLFFPMIGWAQSEPVKHSFYYTMTVNDSVLKNYSDVFLLNISEHATEFKSVQHLIPSPGVTVERSEGRTTVRGKSDAPARNFVRGRMYRDMATNKFKTVETLIVEYLITDSVPEIAWKILPDTATIHGLSCQKATASVLGRVYTVFFAKDIPLPYGPWKLGGLPGLIVDAHDERREFSFTIVSGDAETVKQNVSGISMPSGRLFKTVTSQEYVQHYKLYQENFELYNSMVVGGDVKFTRNDGTSAPQQTRAANTPVVVPLFCRIEMLRAK